jgi:hypothetical protein
MKQEKTTESLRWMTKPSQANLPDPMNPTYLVFLAGERTRRTEVRRQAQIAAGKKAKKTKVSRRRTPKAVSAESALTKPKRKSSKKRNILSDASVTCASTIDSKSISQNKLVDGDSVELVTAESPKAKNCCSTN